jgi:hypothetical protein
MISVIQGLLHGVSHVGPACMMTPLYLALLEAEMRRPHSVISIPIDREHPPRVHAAHHLHVILLLLLGSMIIVVLLILDLDRVVVAKSLRGVGLLICWIAYLRGIVWLLDHSFSIQIHG